MQYIRIELVLLQRVYLEITHNINSIRKQIQREIITYLPYLILPADLIVFYVC